MDKKSKSAWDRLAKRALPCCDENCPQLTTIIPVKDCSHNIAATLNSIVSQNYPNVEVLVIDARSRDRTREIVKGYSRQGVKLYTVSHFQLYEMINRGITLANGQYVNVLFPGDYYLSLDALRFIGAATVENRQPDLVLAGAMLRDREHEPVMLSEKLSAASISIGKAPTSLQGCWWKTDTLITLGKFSTDLKVCGELDLFARFLEAEGLRHSVLPRVLIDSEQRKVRWSRLIRHFLETMWVVWHHYGTAATVKWLFHQRDLQGGVRLWIRGLRYAFVGR